MKKDILYSLIEEARRVLNPLNKGVRNEQSFTNFAKDFGWQLDPGAFTITPIANALKITMELDHVSQIIKDIYSSGYHQVSIDRYLEMLSRMKSIFQAIKQLSSSPAPPGIPNALWVQLSDELLDYLLCAYLKNYRLPLYSLLVLSGFIEQEEITFSGVNSRTNYTKQSIQWARLSRIVTDPGGVLRDVYHCDDSAQPFRYASLLNRLGTIVSSYQLPVVFEPPASDLKDKYYSPSNANVNNVNQLRIYLLREENENGERFELGLLILPIPPQDNLAGVPDGLVITTGFLSEMSKPPDFTLLPFTVELSDLSSLDRMMEIEIHPDGFQTRFNPRVIELSNEVLSVSYEPTYPIILFGTPFTYRFQFTHVQAMLKFEGSLSEPEVIVKILLGNPQFIIDASESDGFLRKIFGDEPHIIDSFDTISWSSISGLRLGGQCGLDLTIPVHNSLGLVTVDQLHFKVAVIDSDLNISVAITANAELGPVSASVREIGFMVRLVDVADSAAPGNFGSLDVEFDFKPPIGAGLGIDAGVIVGGGFLEIDTENARYAGILGLKAAEIGLTAIGLITTRMPDGSEGISLLVSIGVVFTPPIQLPYGFVLQGVGGLLGVNRDMSTEALQAGLRAKALDSILFPDPATVVENASKIISDLRAVFPPAEGRFVIGPMIKIGWGAGRISAEIGIFISLPMPVSVALLGQVSAFFPKPGAEAVVELNMDILGILDLGRNMLTFQASLRDSNLLKTYTLYGDSAFLLAWGASPQFALSMGGFHPKFDPPPPPIVFSGLKRLGLSMSAGSDFSMVCETYQALTPNTLQFGALIDLYAKKSGAKFRGHATFDTLIYFSPFSLEAEVSALVGVEFQGQDLVDVRLQFVLTGPTPWVARGKATIEILFFEGEKSFHFLWGPDKPRTLAAVDPWLKVTEALEQPEAWGSALPPGLQTVESLVSELQSNGTDLIVHPVGRLEVRQQVAPLKMQLAMVGNAPVKDHNQITIDKFEGGHLDENDQFVPAAGPGSTLAHEDTLEHFARAQFESLSDSQKLSAPSFEKMVAGATTARAGTIRTGGQVEKRPLEFESILLPQLPDEEETPRPKGRMAFEREGRWLCAGAVRARQWAIGAPLAARKVTEGRRIEVVEDTYRIVNKDDMKPADGIAQPDAGWTRAEAERVLGVLDPSRREAVIVVTTSEEASVP